MLLHQTVIGQEALKQMELAGEEPDILVGCTGGGSNFAGLVFPFLGKKLTEGKPYRIIAVEPASCPSPSPPPGSPRLQARGGRAASILPWHPLSCLGYTKNMNRTLMVKLIQAHADLGATHCTPGREGQRQRSRDSS